MKKQFFLIVFALLIFANTSIAQLPQYVPANGLVGWWGFNGNANDGSINGNNGVVNGATLTTDRNGNANSAYSYYGTNDYIEIPTMSGLFNSQQYTISFWFRSNQSASDINGTPDVNPAIISRLDNGGPTAVYPYIKDNFTIYEIGGSSHFNSTNTACITGTNTVLDNTWKHIVYTISSDSSRAYLNGNLVDTKAVEGMVSFQSFPIRIGRSKNIYWKDLSGEVDDFGYWNRSLTQQEVIDLYNACALATPIINPLSSTSFCQGGSVQLMSSLQDSSYSYSWYLNNNIISGANQPLYTANTSGDYALKINKDGCSTMSNPVTVTVNSLPNVSVYIPPFINIQNTQVNITGSPLGGVAHGSGVTGMILNPETAGLGTKSILYSYVDYNGCSATATATTVIYDTIKCYVSVTDTLIINTNIGIEDNPTLTNQIKIYPNPAKTNIIIDNGNYSYMNGYSIQIYNTTGQMVYNQQINQQLFNINISTWTGKGLYYVKIVDSTNNIIETKKIVIQ